MAASGSGSGSGRKSRSFTTTCALLRQYVRENQQNPELMGNIAGLLQAPPPSPVAPEDNQDRRTMQLFPARAAAMVPQPVQQRPDAPRAPMTIFYGGRVITFDNFPADKALELVRMAGSSVTAPPPEKVVVDVPEDSDEVVEIQAPGGNQPVPIARKASLHRFLEKRKQRITSAEPAGHKEEVQPAKKTAGNISGEPMEEDVPDALWLRL